MNAGGGLQPTGITAVNVYQNRHATTHEPMGQELRQKAEALQQLQQRRHRNTRKSAGT